MQYHCLRIPKGKEKLVVCLLQHLFPQICWHQEEDNFEEDKQLNFLFKSKKKVFNLIKRLENESKEYELIYPRGSRPGILYGNPKVHKSIINNCPKFRPILSAIGTPTYKLAKFLVYNLSPVRVN